MATLKDKTDVLVIGGGPAGSTASTLLAQQNIDVVCLERDVFPRYHVGESLLPSALEVFDLLGVRQQMEAADFVRKPGAQADWGGERWRLNFGELSGDHLYSFQVERAEFDRILLENARDQGADVFEGHQVTSIDWQDGRCHRAHWANREGTETGTVEFDFLVDASGRAGLIPTRYRRSRTYHQAFKNVAIWGYWVDIDEGDDDFLGAIRFSSIPDGWIWVIPLRAGVTSVGLVVHKDHYQARRQQGLHDIYIDGIRESDFAARIIDPGRLVSNLKMETDYSYGSSSFSGPNYYICGDAACFLDPLLSTGVHLATFSGMLAAAAIGTITRGDLEAERCRNFFEATYQKAYLRLLVMVSAFYDQNRGARGYFWEAQRLTQGDIAGFDMKLAFTQLVSGEADLDESSKIGSLSKIQSAVAARLRENIELRQDKTALADMLTDDGQQDRITGSHTFMNQVEGIFALSPHDSVDNIYLVTKPRLGLAEVTAAP
jgi:flavin-dependent dehydrogenase